jgi:hypothetical protein
MDIVWQAEDSLKEKKVESDLKDLLKTLVAFANSVARNDTAKVFIGERDDGTVQGVTNTDNIQKVKETADKIYPEIYYRTEAYQREGKQCVRVDIRHNGLAPHFGGPAWVRRGSETKEATEELYDQLVAFRSGKARELAQWQDKEITAVWPIEPAKRTAISAGGHTHFLALETARLSFVGQHWVTFDVRIEKVSVWLPRSEPLDNVNLSWDDEKKRLKVLITQAS